jgi:hypothetical protein
MARRVDDKLTEHRSVMELPVPSALPYLDFQTSFVAVWTPGPAIHPAAVHALVDRVCVEAGKTSPVHYKLLASRLAAELAVGMEVESPRVHVRAENFAIVVAPEDLEFARRHAELAAGREVRRAEYAAEDAELEYLQKTVFVRKDTAALWWLRHNGYAVEKLKNVKESLDTLVDEVAAPRQQGWVDELLGALRRGLPDLEPKFEYDLCTRLAQILKLYGSSEVLEEFQARAGGVTASLPEEQKPP